MTYKKLLELEQKFSYKIAQQNSSMSFYDQKDKLSQFFHKFTREIKSIISELGGDIAVLKAKNFDYKTLDVMKQFRHQLIERFKEISLANPYEGTLKLIDWANERMTKSTIDNLDFIAQEFLKTNQVDFIPSLNMSQVRVESFKKLKNFLRAAKDYINDNPLISDPQTQSTVPPPFLRNEVEENTQTNIGPEERTIPSIPAPKKDAV